MNKAVGILALVAGISLEHNVYAATAYEKCMSGAPGDFDIINCNNAEVSRVMRKIQTRYSSLTTNKYFTRWNDQTLSSSQNFQLLLQRWTEYRDKYCALYGYTFSQGIGTITNVQASQCRLDLTNRFAQDVEAIINIYNDMAVTRK